MASIRSLATRPTDGPRRAASPWIHAPAAAARSGGTPLAEQRTDHAGEHVAGPGRGEAFIAGGGDEHGAVGVGDDR